MHKFRSWSLQRVLALFLLFLTTLTSAQDVSGDLMNDLRWRLIGPFRGGRVVAVAGLPGDSTTFYFGAVNGGVWKTTDAGMVWSPISDGQPFGSVGALAVAPSAPKTIYAGTGESDIRSDLSSGNGMYKSVDAGSHWTHIGLDDTRQISKIVVDEQNPNVVYVGALGHAYGPNEQRGVYKSIDGGAHWSKVLEPTSESRTWQYVPATRSFCSPARGTGIVLPGALMLRSMDRAAVFIALKTQAKRGRA